MNRALLVMVMLLMSTSIGYADGGHDHHAIPTMPSLGDTKITVDDRTVTHVRACRFADWARRRSGLQHAEKSVSVAGRHVHDRV